MGLPARMSGQGFTYGDYLRWPAEERWELIEGVAHDMSPAPSRLHQGISTKLIYQLEGFFRDKTCKVYHAPFDVRLPRGSERDEDVDTVVQPDVVVVCAPEKLDDNGCRGAPDLVMEIISPYTAAKDMREKLRLYEKHHVRQYWIVHPVEKIVSIYDLDAAGRYGPPSVFAAGDKIASTLFEGLVIDLDLVFAV